MEKLVCLLVVFMTVFIKAGSAVKCYNCQSNATTDCKDYAKMPIVECLPLKDQLFTPVCIKRILKSEAGFETSLLCTEKHVGNECEPPSIRYNVTDCKICQENLCNHSDLFKFSLVSILVFPLTVFFVKLL